MDVAPHLAPRLDYVDGFQALASVGCELKRSGRNVPLLLQKAMLDLGVGSYEGARDASSSAIHVDPRCAEAHWLNGISLLALCLVDLGILTEGPGEAAPETDEAPLDQLGDARKSLLRCLALGHGQDQEAAELVAFLGNLLAARPGRRLLRHELRCLL